MDQAAEQKPTFELAPLNPEQPPITQLPKRTTELPFFYLTKKKELLRQNITYEGLDEFGRPVRWKVRPNRDPEIGEPAIDAHRVWVLLILPSIELGRKTTGRVAQILPLGGVRKCLRVLDWGSGGHQARRLLRALNQIGASWCEADFFLPVQIAGKLELLPIKGKFSRLSIYAIGEKHLTDEQLSAGKFDFDFDLDATIYLQLHALEMAIQETEEHRYTDNLYMFSVEPTARRWLEIMGPKIFGVVKNNGSHCEIRYSWYVKHHHTLQRLNNRSRVISQMNRVVADHIAAGYILRPEYRVLKEANQEIDFLIRYVPGLMARQSTNRIRAGLQHQPSIAEPAGTRKKEDSIDSVRRPRQRRLNLAPAPESEPQQQKPTVIIDFTLVAEFEKRGVGNADARNLIASLPPGQAILDQLEYGDYQIARQHGRIDNPPGFYISLLRRNVAIPPTFETSQARKARQEAESAKRQAIQKEQAAALAAEETEEALLTDQFERLSEPDRLALLEQAKAEQLKKHPNMAHWLGTNSDASSFLIARARKKLRDGWTPPPQRKPQPGNPHYAINPPVRQDGRLQETAPAQTVADQPQPAQIHLLENLAAILATPQLPAPAAVNQPAVEPAPAAESQPAKPSIDPD